MLRFATELVKSIVIYRTLSAWHGAVTMSKIARSSGTEHWHGKMRWQLTAAKGNGAASAVLLVILAGFAAVASAQERPGTRKPAIPVLASASIRLAGLGVDWLDPPPGLGRGPIRPDPAYPYHGNRDGPGR